MYIIERMRRARQQKIVEYVRQAGIASFDDLAAMFKVSPFTIRRDVAYLDQARLLLMIKGGVQRLDSPSQFSEARLPERMEIHIREKERIAGWALDFIRPGDTVFLDGSSTIACLARLLARKESDITVVTNSVLIALEFAEAAHVRLIGLGGVFDRETMSFVGFEAESRDRSFNIDKAFFSCTGFIPGEGTYENAAFNRSVKRAIAGNAGEVYMLIDSSKFGHKAFGHVLDTRDLDVLITDKALGEDDRKILAENGVKLFDGPQAARREQPTGAAAHFAGTQS